MKIKSIIILSTAALLAACSNNHPVDMTPTAANNKNKPAANQLGSVAARALSNTLRVPGQLKSFNEVFIFPKVNGFVKNIYVDRGSIVHKGQLLMTLEAPEMEGQLQAATSRYTQAQENAAASKEKYNRLKEAAKEPGSVSPLELDNAMARMKADDAIARSEQSNVNSVKAVQDYLNIRAPFDGTITQRNVSPGALVSPGKGTDQPMLVLQDTRKLRLEVYIPEDFADKIDRKQQVSFVLNAMPGTTHKAKISRAANALGGLRSEAVEIDVENQDDTMKPGMYAEVTVPMQSGVKTLAVPNSAIVRSTEREYVVTVEQGRAHLTDIKEGLAGRDSTEVFGTLKAGDQIMNKPSDEVKEGDAVE